ncbi:efflux transporter outer membrane subunit [Rugamonas sp.]|uniref:efflux transporter outer membrane subunit n=1 Tax=Rugamonas sp. TaxID=1926287 RepID=UPI0025FAEEF7|nr:efflux transporter outer membrane subunit [Rugamonas sp.]
MTIRSSTVKAGTVAAALATLTACSTNKPPATVQMEVPAAYREAPAAAEGWTVAMPADAAERGAWWRIYGDARLDALVAQASADSPTLAIALQRVKEARAVAGLADADRAFQLDAGFGPTRSGDNTGHATQWRAQLTAAYEVDLFGRLSDASRAAALDAAGQEAAYRSVLLSLQADVAQNYFALRSYDSELDVLRQTVLLRRDSLRLIQLRYDNGDVSELDLSQAQAELATTLADQEGLQSQRVNRDHALAVLLGKAPAVFTLEPALLATTGIPVPAGLPSELLQRRPDIAQAQRDVAANSARIGVAKAAFYPSLSLSAGAGYASSALHNLFESSSKNWIIGPLFGTILNMPLLDGGRNRSNLALADARYASSVANYRQTVLTAMQDVENNLNALQSLARQITYEEDAVRAAGTAAKLADSRYRNGSASYFEVLDAQRTSLAAQRARSQLAGQRAVASVGLIRALGGGWGPVASSDTAAAL